jgi:hypothetical protein
MEAEAAGQNHPHSAVSAQLCNRSVWQDINAQLQAWVTPAYSRHTADIVQASLTISMTVLPCNDCRWRRISPSDHSSVACRTTCLNCSLMQTRNSLFCCLIALISKQVLHCSSKRWKSFWSATWQRSFKRNMISFLARSRSSAMRADVYTRPQRIQLHSVDDDVECAASRRSATLARL